ncbi:MAG: hypothetical protein AAFW98_09835 [Pseudomonadota bacterium]
MPDERKSCREVYDVYRDYLKHEDSLINNRMTWLILSQSFFFTTYALAIGRLSAAEEPIRTQIETFLNAVATLGIIVGFATCMSILAALNAIEGLKRRWANHGANEATENPTFAEERKRLPDLTGGGNAFASIFGFFMPIVMPLIFVGIWFYVLQIV